jgi:hypothetical protein
VELGVELDVEAGVLDVLSLELEVDLVSAGAVGLLESDEESDEDSDEELLLA